MDVAAVVQARALGRNKLVTQTKVTAAIGANEAIASPNSSQTGLASARTRSTPGREAGSGLQRGSEIFLSRQIKSFCSMRKEDRDGIS